jgi:hypothetical protein
MQLFVLRQINYKKSEIIRLSKKAIYENNVKMNGKLYTKPQKLF